MDRYTDSPAAQPRPRGSDGATRRRTRARRPAPATLAAVLMSLSAAGCSAPDAPSPDPSGGLSSGTASLVTTPTPDPSTDSSAGRTNHRPTAAELAAATADVARLSDRELAGQTVVAGVTDPNAASAVATIRDLHLGGVIVLPAALPDDRDGVAFVRALGAGARDIFAAQGRDWPPVISVDQEGGSVARLRAPLTEFPAPMALGAAGRADLARDMAHASGTELRAAGFTVVYAPDVDVTRGASDVAIGDRALSGDPAEVTRLAGPLVEGYADAGIVPVIKHFPGHGSLTVDSHDDMPTLGGDLDALDRIDLAPFRTLAAQGAPAVMVGHIALAAVDAATPASVSRAVVTGQLRERLGFDGLVITDSLRMGAITRRYDSGTSAVDALRAGVDVVLMPDDPAAAVDAVTTAIRSGRLPRERAVAAAAKTVATLRHGVKEPPAPSTLGAHRSVADAIARASVVQLGGACGARLADDAVSFRGGTPEGRAYLETAARKAGLRVVASGGTSVVLVGGPQYWAGLKKADEVRGQVADVVVSTDSPAYLPLISARTAKLAVFGRGPATYDAIVGVLTGSLRASGKLPVAIDGTPRGAGC